MDRVDFNKKWDIKTKEDYDKAMEILDGNDFIAEMSDDFRYWQSEKAEVARQRRVVKEMAIKAGII